MNRLSNRLGAFWDWFTFNNKYTSAGWKKRPDYRKVEMHILRGGMVYERREGVYTHSCDLGQLVRWREVTGQECAVAVPWDYPVRYWWKNGRRIVRVGEGKAVVFPEEQNCGSVGPVYLGDLQKREVGRQAITALEVPGKPLNKRALLIGVIAVGVLIMVFVVGKGFLGGDKAEGERMLMPDGSVVLVDKDRKVIEILEPAPLPGPGGEGIGPGTLVPGEGSVGPSVVVIPGGGK